MVEIPKMLSFDLLTDTRYLNILLAVKDEPTNNYNISNKIGLDHSQTRKPVKELTDLGALIPQKNKSYKGYLLNKQWLTAQLINHYIHKYAEVSYSLESAKRISSTKIQEFNKLKTSNLTKALVEMYLAGKITPTKDNLDSFFNKFSQYVLMALEKYKVKHIDIDVLQKLLTFTEQSEWSLPELRLLVKYKLNFKKPEMKKDYFDILLGVKDK